MTSSTRRPVWIRSHMLVRQVQAVTAGDNSAEFAVPANEGKIKVCFIRSASLPRDSGPPRLELSAVIERDVSAQRYSVLKDLSDGLVPDGIKVPTGLGDPFDDDGTPLSEIIPPSVKELLAESTRKLSEVCATAARALRWRYGLAVPVQALASLGHTFSVDNARWISWRTPGSVRHRMTVSGVPLNDQVRTDLEQMFVAGLSTPLGHQLLYEAEDVAPAHLRSALALSLSALEVGVKSLIATVVPDSLWLLENLQSPPLNKLMTDYLPRLPIRHHLPGTSAIVMSDALNEEIKKAVTLRNSLIHRGAAKTDGTWLDTWLVLCRSILYAFDCWAGVPWAAQRVPKRHQELLAR